MTEIEDWQFLSDLSDMTEIRVAVVAVLDYRARVARMALSDEELAEEKAEIHERVRTAEEQARVFNARLEGAE